jgi:alanyl-tRNA synthetase
LVSVIGEASVGSGSRRIEAYVGFEAFQALAAERALVTTLSDSFKVPREQLVEKIQATVEELKAASRKLAALSMEQLKSRIPEFLAAAKLIGSSKVVIANLGEVDSADQVRDLAVSLRDKLESESAVVVVSGVSGGKVVLIIATSKKAREAGISSGKLVKEASVILGGGGGGKDDIAQGGGPEAGKLPAAISALEKLIAS